MSISEYVHTLGKQARAASRCMAKVSTGEKNAALEAIADQLDKQRSALQEANERDLVKAQDRGLDAAMLDRLTLTPERIQGMLDGLRQVAALPDPCGEISSMKYLPSGIQVGKMRVPIGVIGIIYESRPNVTIDAASLCLKSGNATILRGGSESLHSNQAIAACIAEGLQRTGLPQDAVQVVNTTDRAAVGKLITQSDSVDVIVPRGGKGLIERISAEATVPVIKHLDGICHVYIDQCADLDKAFNISINSKTHRYGVCNAMETLLVHSETAAAALPRLASAFADKGVELRLCEQSMAVLTSDAASQGIAEHAKLATDEDWASEYLSAILSIKVVQSQDEAVAHINHYGSQHTDVIVTEDYSKARRFITEVDSSSVMVNASTRFADGFEYGLGAEIGISTDKLHARGPVGLEGLTSQKWLVFGDGHIRQ